jgi:hypothetical protein
MVARFRQWAADRLCENGQLDQRRRFGQAPFSTSFGRTLETVLLFSIGCQWRSERDDGEAEACLSPCRS